MQHFVPGMMSVPLLHCFEKPPEITVNTNYERIFCSWHSVHLVFHLLNQTLVDSDGNICVNDFMTWDTVVYLSLLII